IANATVPINQLIQPGTTVFTSTGTSISMTDTGTNQDNCKGDGQPRVRSLLVDRPAWRGRRPAPSPPTPFPSTTHRETTSVTNRSHAKPDRTARRKLRWLVPGLVVIAIGCAVVVGRAATGSPPDFSIDGSTSTLLQPGAPAQPIDLAFSNPNSVS